MTDTHPIILYAGLAAAATYFLYTRPPASIRMNFYNPGKDLVYDPTLVISAYDYRTNKYAKDAFWSNQYRNKNGRYSAPPE